MVTPNVAIPRVATESTAAHLVAVAHESEFTVLATGVDRTSGRDHLAWFSSTNIGDSTLVATGALYPAATQVFTALQTICPRPFVFVEARYAPSSWIERQ